MSDERTLPTFSVCGIGSGFLSDSDMDQLIAEHAPSMTQGKLLTGDANAEIRRSQVVLITNRVSNRWLYRGMWEVAQEFNQRFFCVDISHIEGNIQLARYDASDRGFYDWHTDFSGTAPQRKISISVQLSRPDDYRGGDLELLFQGQPYKCERARGTFIAFPSFTLHRVTPVTSGTRWSLVAWISGARWR